MFPALQNLLHVVRHNHERAAVAVVQFADLRDLLVRKKPRRFSAAQTRIFFQQRNNHRNVTVGERQPPLVDDPAAERRELAKHEVEEVVRSVDEFPLVLPANGTIHLAPGRDSDHAARHVVQHEVA